MAFAKGRAFVILNRMAEQGNSEAAKILQNLNSMSQEDLDSKLSKLFGSGSKGDAGDTKAPEGKKEAPKTTKEPKEGKVVANKDFDPNKEGVQSIFGTEEENAKSKDKKVYGTMEEVMGKKAPKEGKVKDEPRDLDDDYKELRHKEGVVKETKGALKQAREQSANNPQRLKELDETEKKLDAYIGEPLGKEAPKEMKSAKEGIKPLESDQNKSKELYNFVKNADNERVNQLVKETPALAPYLAEFETYVSADDEFTLEGFAEYLDAQSENVEDTPEKNKEVRAVKAFVDKKLGRGQTDPLKAQAEAQDKYVAGLPKDAQKQVRSKYSMDTLENQQKELDERRNRPYGAEEVTKELQDTYDKLVAKGDRTPEEVLNQLKTDLKDDPERLAIIKEIGKNKIKPTQTQEGFGTGMGAGIGGGQKDLVGKKADIADPNRPDLMAEMEQEIEDTLSQWGQDEEGIDDAVAEVKRRFKDDPERLAAIDRLEIKRAGGYEATPEGGKAAVDKLRAEAAQKAQGSDWDKNATPEATNKEYFKLEDEFMADFNGANSMELISQLREKYKGDANKQQALKKLEGKEKFRAAANEYIEKNSETSPLWAKSGMTGSQKLWDANRVKDAMFDFINDEPTIEAALAQARSVFEGSKYSEEFINYLEQKILGTTTKGSATNPMTDARQGIKPVKK